MLYNPYFLCHRPEIMDPLSDVLSLLKPRSYMAGGFDVGGEWALQFHRHDDIKCYAIVSGECWLATELREQRPGHELVAQHMAHLMLVQALRLVLAEGEGRGVGWLYALADPQIGGAIGALHGEPSQRWTLESLAQHVGMSRSTLALKFKQTVGASPMEYLTRWRMLLAGDRLVNSKQPVSAIAQGLGYESDSAFSTAFKRVMGCSPRQYVRDQAL